MTNIFDFSLIELYFHVSPAGAAHPVFEMPAEQFLDAQQARAAYEQAGRIVRALGPELPASFTGTSMCNLCSIQLLMFAQNSVWLDLTLPNLMFQVEQHDDHAHLGYRILELRSTAAPAGNQEEWLFEQFDAYIRGMIVPAVRAMAEAAGAKPAMIWQQFGGHLAYVRDYVQQYISNPQVVEAFELGFRVLTDMIPAEAFGLRRNPFIHQPRYIDNPYVQDGRTIMKSSCCLYDRRENGTKCYACPRLTEAERDVMREQIKAQLQPQNS